MNWEAGKLLRTGLTEQQALSTVTIQSARAIAIDDRVGSLEPGKDGDFVVWNGNPLSQFTRPEQTWLDGRRYFSIDEDMELRTDQGRTKPSYSGGAFFANRKRPSRRRRMMMNIKPMKVSVIAAIVCRWLSMVRYG